MDPDATDAASAPKAISSSAVAPIMIIQERTVRSLSHSDRMTRRWVTANPAPSWMRLGSAAAGWQWSR